MEDKYKLLIHNLTNYLYNPTKLVENFNENDIIGEFENFLQVFPKYVSNNVGYVSLYSDTLNLYFSGSEELGYNFEISKSFSSKTHLVVSSKFIPTEEALKLNELLGSVLSCNSYSEFCILSDIGDFHSIIEKGKIK